MTAGSHSARRGRFLEASYITFARLVTKSMSRWKRKVLITLATVFPVAFVAVSYLEDLIETTTQERSVEIIGLITGLPSHVINMASNSGYSGIFLLTLFDSAGLPFPSEIVLPLAGYLVFARALQYWPVVFCTTVAALLGSSADYYIGRRLGSRFISGKTRLPYLSTTHLHRVQSWFDMHGHAAVAFLRLVPVARVLISFPAGATRMNPVSFEFYSFLGCLTWNMALVSLGWWLGSSWSVVTSAFRYVSLYVYVAVALFVIWILSRRKIQNQSNRKVP